MPTLETVHRLVVERYGLEPTRAVLVRSFTNDVYRIDVGRASYALKVYGASRWTVDEIRWEQELVRHLTASGLPVAAAVPLVDGDTAGFLNAPEGKRPFALAEWVEGEKPQPPRTDALYRDVGTMLARFHDAADHLHAQFPRRARRTGQEATDVIGALGDDAESRELVQRLAPEAEHQLARLGEAGLHWAIQHGDPSLDNLHVSDHGLQLYDFDLAGPGWQVEDLTGALSTPFADVFLAGYTAVRPLAAVELEALPWLHITGLIENLRFHLVEKPAAYGTSSLAEGWVDRELESLAAVAREVGLDG